MNKRIELTRRVSIRRGTTATEVLVAATLLLSMIGMIVPITVRTGRIWQDTRHYQLAMNELSNQLEYLCSLPADQRDDAVAKIAVSETVRDSLPNPQLDAKKVEDDDGMYFTLSLNWQRGPNSVPLKLTGWIGLSARQEPVSLPAETLQETSNETK